MGAASASQLMAAVESRELVSAVRSFADPNAPRPTCLREEREQKAEQQLEHRGTNCENVYGKCTPHLTRGAASQKAAKRTNKSVRRSRTQFNSRFVSFSVR
jgi:hypothetical protein